MPGPASAGGAGVAGIYTPKDFRLAAIVDDLAALAVERRRRTKTAARAG